MMLDKWRGKFGDDYSMRNRPDALKRSYLFNLIWKNLTPTPKSVLEVGCNVGTNLVAIVKMYLRHSENGFLCGVEPNERAARMAEMDGFKIYRDPGEDLHFLDRSFDLVFCAGVLIHQVDPERMIEEMIRVTKRHLLFVEYFSGQDTMVEYRDDVFLMKRNWPEYFKRCGITEEMLVISGEANAAQGFDDCNFWLYKVG